MALLHDYGVAAQKGEMVVLLNTALLFWMPDIAIKPFVKHSVRKYSPYM